MPPGDPHEDEAEGSVAGLRGELAATRQAVKQLGLVGLPEAVARQQARASGLRVRVLTRGQVISTEMATNRVNLSVANGRVTDVSVG